MNDDQLDLIVKGLKDDGIYIAPELESIVSSEQLSTMRSSITNSDQPVFVVIVDAVDHGPFAGDVNEMLAQVHDESGEPGTYLSAIGFGSNTVAYLVDETWGGDLLPEKVRDAAEVAHPNDAVAQVVSVVDFNANGIPERLQGVQPSKSYADGEPGDGDGPPWVPMGLVAALIVAVVALVISRRRTRPAPLALTLPASVVARAASQSLVRQRAKAAQDIVALGERIDDTDLSDQHSTQAWQAALDRYEAGTRLLDSIETTDEQPRREPDSSARASASPLLDVLGAIVLARQGQQALDAALRGEEFTPPPHCYLHPLHEGETRQTTLENGGRRVKVPLCEACRRDLERGETPDGLDVMVDGEPRHYFDAEIQPWSQTAFGADGSDLVAALATRDR